MTLDAATEHAAPPGPAAVLWDMDGTLVDTEPYWHRAECELVAEHGGTWTNEQSRKTLGMGIPDAALILRAEGGVALSPEEITEDLVDRVQTLIVRHGLPWCPGARELLQALRAAGVRTALVTMSIRRLADQVVAALGFDGFDVVVSGDEVTRAKPDPEAYLQAARTLGVEVTQCVAIEDSVPGLTAAVSAGAVVLGVPHSDTVPADLGDVQLTSLEGITVDTLRTIYDDIRGRRRGVADVVSPSAVNA